MYCLYDSIFVKDIMRVGVIMNSRAVVLHNFCVFHMVRIVNTRGNLQISGLCPDTLRDLSIKMVTELYNLCVEMVLCNSTVYLILCKFYGFVSTTARAG